jgi:predicted Zn-dependent protease
MSTHVALASVQLLAGRAKDAERNARADLTRYPANGWALYALAESLRRQGRNDEAARAKREFERVWQRADLPRPDARY